LKIFRKIGEFRAESELTTWLYRMTVNACIDEQRKRRNFSRWKTFSASRKLNNTPGR
jgi:DNA-directed RNA polymerase specialized sigma24 family protein